MATTQSQSDYAQVQVRQSVLARFILHRLNKGRDVKILIIARGAATGTGKSTLAVLINHWVHSLFQCPECRFENEHGLLVGGFFTPDHDECPRCGTTEVIQRPGWNAEEQSYIDIWDYADYYSNRSSPGDAMLLDEAEDGLDNRRSMSGSNVEVSRIWSALRFKNCVSVTTMPSILHVDKRMEELADVLITVQERGRAIADWLWLNDSEREVWTPPMKSEWGHREEIFFDSLENDPEYKKVAQIKDQHFDGDEGQRRWDEEEVEKKIEEETRDIRIGVKRLGLNKTRPCVPRRVLRYTCGVPVDTPRRSSVRVHTLLNAYDYLR